MKVVIAGSRTISAYRQVAGMPKGCMERHHDNFRALVKAIDESRWLITEVGCGLAPGADTIGEMWAKDCRIPIRFFRANWVTFGRRAGMLRNKEMAQWADAAIILWDGVSNGTRNMKAEMELLDKPALVKLVKLVPDPESLTL